MQENYTRRLSVSRPEDMSGAGNRKLFSGSTGRTNLASRSILAGAGAFAAMLALIVVGNILVFPAIDDAWLELVEKENGPGHLSRFIYRPFFAWLLDIMHPSTRAFESIGVFVTFCSWALLALVTYRLGRILFPHLKSGAIAAAVLVIAPVITSVQLVTLNLAVPVTIPVLCGYGALLLTYERQTALRLITAAALIIAGMMISEYTMASVTAAFVLLVMRPELKGTQRRQSLKTAGVLFGAAVLGYVGFRLVANMGMRPDASPSSMMRTLVGHPVEAVLHIVNSTWYCLAGGFLRSANGIRFGSEGSVMAALAFGLAVAALVAVAVRSGNQGNFVAARDSWQNWLVAGLALMAALIPEFLRQGVFFVTPGEVEPFSTRFCVAAAPIAAIMLVEGLNSVSRRPVLVSAIVTFVAAHAAFLSTYKEYRNQASMRRLGDILRPYVASNPEITLAVVPTYYARAYEQTEKASALWPADLSRRLWMVWEGQIPLYLHRLPERSGACDTMRQMDVNSLGVRRSGRIGQILWVQPQKDGEFNVEHYCVSSYLPPGAAKLPVRNDASAPLPTSLIGY